MIVPQGHAHNFTAERARRAPTAGAEDLRRRHSSVNRTHPRSAGTTGLSAPRPATARPLAPGREMPQGSARGGERPPLTATSRPSFLRARQDVPAPFPRRHWGRNQHHPSYAIRQATEPHLPPNCREQHWHTSLRGAVAHLESRITATFPLDIQNSSNRPSDHRGRPSTALRSVGRRCTQVFNRLYDQAARPGRRYISTRHLPYVISFSSSVSLRGCAQRVPISIAASGLDQARTS